MPTWSRYGDEDGLAAQPSPTTGHCVLTVRGHAQGGKYVGFGSAGSAPPRPAQGTSIDQVTSMLSSGWSQLSSVAGASHTNPGRPARPPARPPALGVALQRVPVTCISNDL